MHKPFPTDATIHPSVYRHGGGFLRWVAAKQRRYGAVRYRCPVTGSFVLVTDAAALKRLARPRARIRCAGCNEMHLLTPDIEEADNDATAVIVGRRGRS